MASRRRSTYCGSDSDEDDLGSNAADEFPEYGSPPVGKSRLGKQGSRKRDRRSKPEGRRSSGARKKPSHVPGRNSPANASSGSEDKRTTGERRAAETESRTAQRKKDRYEKFTLSGQHSGGFLDVRDGSDGDKAEKLPGLSSSFSELSLSSDGGGNGTSSSRPSGRVQNTTGYGTPTSVPASSSLLDTTEPVGRRDLHRYASQVVRGLELVESAHFYVKQALSIGSEAEVKGKGPASRLWMDLQAALRDHDIAHHQSVLCSARSHVDKLMCEIEQFQWNTDPSRHSRALETQGINRTFAKALSASFLDDSRQKMEVVEGLECFPLKHRVALQAVNRYISLFDQACTLYPSQSELFYCERPDGHGIFDNRLATLLAWSNASWELATTLGILKSWMHVNVSCVVLESVESDDASDIVLSALSNLGSSASSTLEPVQEHPVANVSPNSRFPVSRSVPAPTPAALEIPPDVTRSKSDNVSQAADGPKKASSTHRYSSFVDSALKRLGLTVLLKRLLGMADKVIRRVHSMFLSPYEQFNFTLEVPCFSDSSILSSPSSDSRSFVSRALSFSSLAQSTTTAGTLFSRQPSTALSSCGTSPAMFPMHSSWEDEFSDVGLPSLAEPYLALLRVPLDVIHEVVRLWLEQQPGWKPSAISIRQLLLESKELLVAAYEIKMYYVQLLEAALPYLSTLYQRQLEVSQVSFEQDLKKVLETYLGLLHSYVQIIARPEYADLDPVHVLEEEWLFMCRLVPQVRRGMSHVGRRFCIIAQGFVENLCNLLESRLDDCTSELHNLSQSEDVRSELLKFYRSFQKLFQEVRKRSSKAIGFGRMLRKEMQIAADFGRVATCDEAMLLNRLLETGHALVHITNSTCRAVFVSPSMVDQPRNVLKLLNIACGRAGTERWAVEGYLVLLAQSTSPPTSQPGSAYGSLSSTTTLLNNMEAVIGGSDSDSAFKTSLSNETHYSTDTLPVNPESVLNSWSGPVIELELSKETAYALGELPVDDVKVVVSQSSSLSACRQMFQHLVADLVDVTQETTSTYHDVGESLADLTNATIQLGVRLMKTVDEVGTNLLQDIICELETSSLNKGIKPGFVKTMQRCYSTVFEFLAEVERLVAGPQCRTLGKDLAAFVTGWMKYVARFCDMSLHSQPRWMAQGLKFVTMTCQEEFTVGLSDAEYKMFSFEVTEFLEKFQFGNKTNESFQDISPQGDDSPWHSVDQEDSSPRAKKERYWSAPILVRHRPMLTRRTNSERILRWYSASGSTSGSSSPVTAYPPYEKKTASLPVPGSGYLVDDSSSADEMIGPVVRRFRSTSEPVGMELKKPGRLSPVVGSPNDAPMESLPRFRDAQRSQHKAFKPCMSLIADESNSSSLLSQPATFTPADNAVDASAPTAREHTAAAPAASYDFYPKRIKRCQGQLEEVDAKRALEMREKRLVGKVMSAEFQPSGRTSIISLNLKHVRFRWQRGNKIGTGKFGKVYSCVNLDNGAIMAVKEVVFQGSSSGAIKDLADEIKMMENIKHPHLVHYYGVEKHQEELLIFMEYCPGGTMHDLAKQGPPESVIRQWINQLLQAIQVLHDNGIVHGDIKGANIFLTPAGGVKLGDFGSSAKLADVAGTRHGELVGMRGTVAFMAPEVVHQNQGRGFGRPADIWSTGCVVVELMTGKHPWSEVDNEFSIMYCVGDGKHPALPDNLSEECAGFLEKCFIVDPFDRWTASQLLDHLFVRARETLSL